MSNSSATVHPVDDQILIRRTEDKTTPAGLELVHGDDASRVLRGAIAAVGPGMPTMSGARAPLAVAGPKGQPLLVTAGDGVIYRAEDAQELTIESGKFDVLRFRDAIAVLKVDPE